MTIRLKADQSLEMTQDSEVYLCIERNCEIKMTSNYKC